MASLRRALPGAQQEQQQLGAGSWRCVLSRRVCLFVGGRVLLLAAEQRRSGRHGGASGGTTTPNKQAAFTKRGSAAPPAAQARRSDPHIALTMSKRKADEEVVVISDDEEQGAAGGVGAAPEAQRRRQDTDEGASAPSGITREPAVSSAAPFRLTERRGDLFSVEPSVSLAHCVARDLRLGKVRPSAIFGALISACAQRRSSLQHAVQPSSFFHPTVFSSNLGRVDGSVPVFAQGIALLFRNRFGGVDEMHRMNLRIGDVGALRRGERSIYALVTKERSAGSYPTLASMRQALVALRDRMARDGVTTVAAPRIGCGLDRLSWNDVRPIIEDVFGGARGVEFIVYAL